MTRNSMTAEERMGRLGIHLPEAPTPFGTYRRHVPKAQVHVLDAGHFALDTAADEITNLVRRFMWNKK